MTTYTITPSTGVHTTGDNQPAFTGDSSGPDALVVQAGAFLTTAGSGSSGARLANTGAWTATIDGSVVSQQDQGLLLQSDNAGTSKITVGAEGQVYGHWDGILALSTAEITNHGTIAGNADGIYLGGAGNHVVTNTGTIEGGYSVFASGATGAIRVDNSGTMVGSLHLGEGDDTLTNTGLIQGPEPNSSVSLGEGRNTLTNAGTIEGYLNGGDGVDTVRNSGTLAKDVFLYDGADVFVNSQVVGGTTVSGQVGGVIEAMGGNDNVQGGAFVERVVDGLGSDGVTLNGGNDAYLAVTDKGSAVTVADGTDTVSGGTGIDTYDAVGAKAGVIVNLDTVSHHLGPYAPNASPMAAGRAQGADVSGAGYDAISGFENAWGGNAADVLYGSGTANALDGEGGNDWLKGYGGDDRLDGDRGLDSLMGGTGRDVLIGGGESDSFIFTSAADSGPTAATRDTILDFQDGADRIDLTYLDAKAGTGAVDDFAFIGTNVGWGGQAGQLRAVWTAQGQRIEGDTDGDRDADFSVAIMDTGHSVQLTGADFIF